MKHGCISQLCDSPIEKHFIDGWISNNPGAYVTRREVSGCKSLLCMETPLKEYAIYCQQKIGVYRVDFLVVFIEGEKRVIVECDGHEFHQTTPEQATKDRSRERDLVRMGYTVLRFTGSELYKNGAACAREVQEYLEVKHA